MFCGHEYTVNNLKFASLVEPNNGNIKNKLKWALEKREINEPTVPSTIEEELLFNPFTRVHETSVKEHTGQTDPILVMQSLRKEKDNWKPSL